MSITKITDSASLVTLFETPQTSDLTARVQTVSTALVFPQMTFYYQFINWAENLTLQVKKFYWQTYHPTVLHEILSEIAPEELQTEQDLDKEPFLSLKGKMIDLLLEIDVANREQIKVASYCSLAIYKNIFNTVDELSTKKMSIESHPQNFQNSATYDLAQYLRQIKAFRQAIQLLPKISDVDKKQKITIELAKDLSEIGDFDLAIMLAEEIKDDELKELTLDHIFHSEIKVTNLNRSLRLAQNTKNEVLHDRILRSICHFIMTNKFKSNQKTKQNQYYYQYTDLLPFISQNLQIGTWVDSILDVAEIIIDPENKALVFVELCETLTKDQLFDWAFEIAKRIPPSRQRCETLFYVFNAGFEKKEYVWSTQVLKEVRNDYYKNLGAQRLQKYSS